MPSTPESIEPSDSTADGSPEDLAGLSFEEIFNTGPLIAMGAIPEDLAFVIASREIFDSAVHPLTGVMPGTVMDANPDLLAGCWGRVAAKSVTNWSPSDADSDTDSQPTSVERISAEVFKIDPVSGIAQRQELHGIDEGLPVYEDRPLLAVFDLVFEQMTSNELTADVEHVDVVVIEPDGMFVYDFLSLLLFGWEPLEERLYTLDGDFLATWFMPHDGSDPLPESANLWYRFECVVAMIEPLPVSELTIDDLGDSDPDDFEQTNEDVFTLFEEGEADASDGD